MGKKRKILSGLIIIFFAGSVLLLNPQKIFTLRPVIIKHKLIFVETAKTAAQRSKGLKYRRSLAKNRGMLFIFEEEKYLKFWMKDTVIPLSIAFIDKQKKIVDIQKMPVEATNIFHTAAKQAKYALEMNAGWFEQNGIVVGDRLIF